MSRRERQKASDVFREKDYLLGKTTSFGEAFPMIEDLRVVVTEYGDDVRGIMGDYGERKHYFSIDHPPGEYVDCSNEICYNGGVRVGQYLRQMVRQGETEGEFSDFCQGDEGSPKGQNKYGPCDHRFETEIELTYTEDYEAGNPSGS